MAILKRTNKSTQGMQVCVCISISKYDRHQPQVLQAQVKTEWKVIANQITERYHMNPNYTKLLAKDVAKRLMVILVEPWIHSKGILPIAVVLENNKKIGASLDEKLKTETVPASFQLLDNVEKRKMYAFLDGLMVNGYNQLKWFQPIG